VISQLTQLQGKLVGMEKVFAEKMARAQQAMDARYILARLLVAIIFSYFF
jgi:hypothetical protein